MYNQKKITFISNISYFTYSAYKNKKLQKNLAICSIYKFEFRAGRMFEMFVLYLD